MSHAQDFLPLKIMWQKKRKKRWKGEGNLGEVVGLELRWQP